MRRSALPIAIVLFAGLAVASLAMNAPTIGGAAPRIDHVMLGTDDLEWAIVAFEAATGVRPAYGGKHPTGTHNALVSLGGGAYLELIAPQGGADSAAASGDPGRLTPVGWAVSGTEAQGLRQRLSDAGFGTTSPRPGSRTTPSGAVLQWQTFGLAEALPGAPFFIVWAAESPHPASTSPEGCTLKRLTVAGPASRRLARLLEVLGLPVESTASPRVEFRVELSCPKGVVSFGPLR